MLMDDGLYGDAVKDYWCVFLNIFMLITSGKGVKRLTHFLDVLILVWFGASFLKTNVTNDPFYLDGNG